MNKNSKTEEKIKQTFYFKLLKSVNKIEPVATQFAIDAANQHKVLRCDVTQLRGRIHNFIPVHIGFSRSL